MVDTATGWLIVGVIGFLMALVGFGALLGLKGAGKRGFGILGIVGLVVIGLSVFVPPLIPASTSNGPSTAPSTAAVSVVLASTPALPSGCTAYTSTNTVNCLIVYNKTSNYFAIQPTLSSGTAAGQQYLLLGFKVIRTDALNTTFLFGNTLSSIYTTNSLGATPTTYGIIGYTSATSTTPGTWQVFPGSGTLASQKPTVSAPTTATNLETTGLAVQSFGSVTNVWHFSLAGKNSTSAPNLFAQALTNFTAYPNVMTFANAPAAQSTWTVTFTMIGWDA